MDPGATLEEVLDQLAAMDRAAIPQQDNGATQMMEQLLEKPYHFFPSESAPVELDVERHPLTHGKRASSAMKTKELCQVGNRPSGPFALDFHGAFASIPP